MILNKQYKQTLKVATKHFGIDHRDRKTCEELSELIKEVIKDRKDETQRKINLLDEIADCLIMIQNQIIINKFSKKELNKRISFKIKRLRKIMKKETIDEK